MLGVENLAGGLNSPNPLLSTRTLAHTMFPFKLPVFSRSYCYTVWSAIGIILLSICPSVCDAVHCGSQGWCTRLKAAPACS